MNRTVLITGISGQDGSLLMKKLLSEGVFVVGLTRKKNEHFNAEQFFSERQIPADQFSQCSLVPVNYTDLSVMRSVFSEFKPSQVYHFAGESSVGFSIEYPVETVSSNTQILAVLLEAIRLEWSTAKVFVASSGEVFGSQSSKEVVDELTPHNPVNPYGLSKSLCHQIVQYYRDTHQLFISIGILFQHESIFRPAHFFFGKLVDAVVDLYENKVSFVEFGNLDVTRDIGFADDYIEGFQQSLNIPFGDTFIFASGAQVCLRDVLGQALSLLGLDSSRVRYSASMSRSHDERSYRASTTKAAEVLQWRSTTSLNHMLEALLEHKLRARGLSHSLNRPQL